MDALAAFAQATGWQVLYGVNMKLSSPNVAADEASYAAADLGDALYGFEIGSEPDLYTTVASSPGAWSLSEFEADWSSFANAMTAAVPWATLTGPALAYRYASWGAPFAADQATAISLLTQHYYVASGRDPESTIAKLCKQILRS